MNPLCLTFGLLLAIGSYAIAQDDKTPPASKEVSLFSFAIAPEHQTIYMNDAKAGFTKISLSTANVRGPYKTYLSRDGEVLLHSKVEAEDGTETYPVIARVNVKEDVPEPLLVLIPSNKPEPYAAIVLDGDIQDFPQGTCKLVNFSKNDIRAAIGKTPVLAAAGSIQTIDLTKNSERLLQVVFQHQDGGRWKTFSSSRWPNDGTARTLLFAFPNPKTQRMQIRGIPLR